MPRASVRRLRNTLLPYCWSLDALHFLLPQRHVFSFLVTKVQAWSNPPQCRCLSLIPVPSQSWGGWGRSVLPQAPLGMTGLWWSRAEEGASLVLWAPTCPPCTDGRSHLGGAEGTPKEEGPSFHSLCMFMFLFPRLPGCLDSDPG